MALLRYVWTTLGATMFLGTASVVMCTIWAQQLPPPQNRPFPPPPPPWWDPESRPHTPQRGPMPPRVWPFPATLNLIRPGLWSTYNGTLLQAVSPEEVTFITRLHNELRQTLAAGKLPGFPTAADMLRLEYDGEVARRAQVHSQSCRFQHGCFGCGQIRGYIGQNLFLAPRGNWEQAIRTWWDEHRKTNRDVISRYNFSPRNGHFTQIAWSRTGKVGCGATDCPQLGGRYMVCNYEPGGNMLRQPVYREGWPCSQCPQGMSCTSLDGQESQEMSLCGSESFNCPPEPPALSNRPASTSSPEVPTLLTRPGT
ncbi:scoloptoxin SSD976 isoform X2 [Dermacentor silvarum]|uniref:scoloptoxin SSD976 isoform X2 n=1 Tax=Dermacentor silvarum TaxID=543639 RepID=UPI002100CFFD|nr:scoloptoxin SSD976 isoform X2 [Dermacentor silvarum]